MHSPLFPEVSETSCVSSVWLLNVSGYSLMFARVTVKIIALTPLQCATLKSLSIHSDQRGARGCNSPVSKGFPFLCLAPYCARGGIRVVSGGRGLCVAGSFAKRSASLLWR